MFFSPFFFFFFPLPVWTINTFQKALFSSAANGRKKEEGEAEEKKVEEKTVFEAYFDSGLSLEGAETDK